MIGRFAVSVDWSGPIDRQRHARMLDVDPYRDFGRVASYTDDGVVLSEFGGNPASRSAPSVGVDGGCAIVGDIVLWNTTALRNRAGTAPGAALDDRRLILAAYRRAGLAFLDDLYGEYAFVIWDASERRLVAVRDHIGIRPLFFTRSSDGLRLASHPKQLLVGSLTSPAPDPRMISEHLTGRHRDSTLSFFSDVERLPPAHVLISSREGTRTRRYWNPGDSSLPPPRTADVVEGFRDQLVASVERRVAASRGVVSHLSGGLDSGSVTASAHILAADDRLPAPVSTMSVVFPDYPDVDESRWIDEVVAMQPFDHHAVEPAIVPIDVFSEDMWNTDTPDANPLRVMWASTGPIAAATGADTVLMGFGGDEINDQRQLLIDRLRYGSLGDRYRVARAHQSTSSIDLSGILASEARDHVPEWMRRPLRRVVPRRGDDLDLRTTDLADHDIGEPLLLAGLTQDFSRAAQFGVVATTQTALLTRVLELEDARYASVGNRVTHPYLDRQVVEYLASIPVEDRPFDGRSKTLVRQGFVGWLPESVLARRTNTVSDPYLDDVLPAHRAAFVARYPDVSAAAREWIDPSVYRSLLTRSSAGSIDFMTRTLLWRAWTLMLWLDGFDRYRN